MMVEENGQSLADEMNQEPSFSLAPHDADPSTAESVSPRAQPQSPLQPQLAKSGEIKAQGFDDVDDQ